MALALMPSSNSSERPNLKPMIGKNYDLKLAQSIQNVLAEIHNKTPNFSHFIQEFYQLMQSRVDPPLESIWVYAALTFHTRNHPKDDQLDRISAAKDLFQLVSAWSASSTSSQSIALLAPVVYEVCNVVVDMLKMDLSSRREKKAMNEVKNLIGVILGYANLSSFRDLGDNDSSIGLNSIAPFLSLIRVWMNSNEGLESFLPLVSSEVFGILTEKGGDVGYLAAVAIVELFLLKLCLNLKVGTPREELETELRTWSIGSITGFQNLYHFEILLGMLLEGTLPVTSLLSSEDEILLRKVLYDAIILVDYSFLNPGKVIRIPAENMRSLALKRLIFAHEAVEFFREHGDQKRAISYVTAFSSSQLSSQIIKWVKNQIPIRSIGGSPKALIKWLLNLENLGLRVFHDSIAKFRTKLALDLSKSDSEQLVSKLGNKMVDEDLLFYIDNKGEDQHSDEENNEKENEFMSAAFVDAAHTMTSTEKRGSKRKGTNGEKKEKIKFVKYDLHPNSESAAGRSSLINNDRPNSGSEVENALSDGDAESEEQ